MNESMNADTPMVCPGAVAPPRIVHHSTIHQPRKARSVSWLSMVTPGFLPRLRPSASWYFSS